MEKKIKRNRLLILDDKKPFQFIEAYKSLRTNLQYLTIDRQVKKIVVTSSIPGEGKTTVAINLAITLAQTGKKVLLVDCDLRKPQVHRYLHIGMGKLGGVTSLLSDKMKSEDCIVCLEDCGMYVLASGPIPPNPAELLGTQKMQSIINEFSEQFDYVIMDTPPVSAVTDAAVLSKFSDGILFVLRQNYTKIETAQLAKKNLTGVNANIIGCVFNAFKAEKSSKSAYYDNKYYQYYYK